MSETITISKSGNPAFRQIKINSKWFENSEYFSVKQTENSMTIVKHYLEIPDTARKTIRGYFHVPCAFPVGRHEICTEDSTEDELVIYFDWAGISY
jgi:hypothetical protein